MTGHQIESFVGDLVAMAQATKRLPEVEADLRDATIQMNGQAETIQRLELKLMDAKNLEDSLRSSIRDLEVARDDAELRFLELDDKVGKVMGMVDMAATYCKDAIILIDPPKPEPQPVEVPQANVDPIPSAGSQESHSAPTASASEPVERGEEVIRFSGESASPPTSAPSAPIGTGTENVASSYEAAPAYLDVPTPLPPSSWASSSGQSEVDPTASTADATSGVIATTNAQRSPETKRPQQPYLNKRYSEVLGFVSYSDWIDGGGTAENRNL